MTLVTLPYRPIAGDVQDVSQIMANLDAIVQVLNGGLTNVNFAAGAAIPVSKLGGGVDNQLVRSAPSGGGVAPVFYTVPKARLYRGSNFDVAHAIFTAIPYNFEFFDDSKMHGSDSTVADDATKVAIPLTGLYVAIAWVFHSNQHGASVGAIKLVEIRKNGVGVGTYTDTAAVLGAQQQDTTHAVFTAAVNDYIQVFVYQDTSFTEAQYTSELAIVRLC